MDDINNVGVSGSTIFGHLCWVAMDVRKSVTFRVRGESMKWHNSARELPPIGETVLIWSEHGVALGVLEASVQGVVFRYDSEVGNRLHDIPDSSLYWLRLINPNYDYEGRYTYR